MDYKQGVWADWRKSIEETYFINYDGAVRAAPDGNLRAWRKRLSDDRARALIASKLDRLAYGHAGDAHPVGDGIQELRIHYGPGYRIYFRTRGTR